MRFSIPTAALRGPLGHAFQAAGRGAVWCEAGADRLTLVGRDAEGGVTIVVPTEVTRPGAVLLPPQALAVVRKYDDEVLEAEAVGRTLTLRARDAEYELATEDPASFQHLPDAPDSATTLSAGPLLTAIDRTLFAASRDEGKYAMRGVLWDSSALVGTNGHQLAVADLAVGGPGALLPPKAVEVVRKLLAECAEDEEVGVVLRENDAFVTTPRGLVYTRLVEGRFPPYRDVIPKKAITVVALDWAAFVTDVERAELLTTDDARRVEFAFTDRGLTLRVPGTSVGKAAVPHAHLGLTGPPLTVTFDPKFVLSARRAFRGQVALEMTTPERAGVFRADGYLLLVVPLA